MGKAYVHRTGDVAELVISAPPLNLFDGQLATDLEDALDEIIAQCWPGGKTPRNPPLPDEPLPPEPRWARAVLLRAEGKVFCAGVDVHEFQGLGPSQGAGLMARFLALVQTLERLPVPTIAVVHALNLTIGFELSLGCDLMWAAQDASFGLVEATVGLTPGGGGTQRLVARAGVARAAELVMTGDIYPAAEMHQWGVVNRILPPADLLEEARAFAARLAAGPTAATAVGKRLLQIARDHGVAAADAVTPRETGQIFATRDLPAGLASLLEHGPRQATFEGR
ncbi:MAG: enoyl-CoA hydratase/isomerase family protein [Streptosporangiaceae bacterium]|jgi:enoyl-CoA hydratase/carnithine racemase